jgi:predicted nucleic acid-binding OB-fold protein
VRLFLQINIVNWQEVNYNKPFLSFASSLADDIVGTDLDNQSDAYLADLISKLINEAEKVFVLVVSDNPMLPLGGSSHVFNQLIKVKDKVHLAVLSGEHIMAERMLKPFQDNFKKQEDDELIRKLIKQFAYC